MGKGPVAGLRLDAAQYLLGAAAGVWLLAASFVGGGILGGCFGAVAARRPSASKEGLSILFAGLIFAVAACMLWKSLVAA